jgi:hypothetical protein
MILAQRGTFASLTGSSGGPEANSAATAVSWGNGVSSVISAMMPERALLLKILESDGEVSRYSGNDYGNIIDRSLRSASRTPIA